MGQGVACTNVPGVGYKNVLGVESSVIKGFEEFKSKCLMQG